ncbi:MAG: iron-sulfur cluster assembly protein [Planctomycetota bacterium]
MPTVEDIYAELKQVFDPEIPVNIVDLGLIYDVKVEDTICKIQMTLTSQACPEAKTIPDVMKRRCNTVEGIEETEIDIVWEPQWGPQLISPEGRKILGIEDDAIPSPPPAATDAPPPSQ